VERQGRDDGRPGVSDAGRAQPLRLSGRGRIPRHQGSIAEARNHRRSLGAVSVAQARQPDAVAQAAVRPQTDDRRRNPDRGLGFLLRATDLDARASGMAKKPAGLIYGVDDRPPPPALVLLAVQHIFLMSSTLVLPIVLVTEIGGDFAEVTAVVALTMIACGIGTILQAMRWRGIGSGFLCPNLCGPNFFAASVGAAWLGGLPLMRGMTIVAGVVELVFARLVHRLAFLFPTEITGLVVFMVGISLIPVGTSKFLHIDCEPIQPISFLAAGATLLVMVALTIWGGAKLRLYSVVIGMALGYALSAAAGLLPAER